MALSKTAVALLADAKHGRVSVEYGYQYGRQYGKRALNAAHELVNAGKLQFVTTHDVNVKKNGYTVMHGAQFVFKIIQGA